MSNLAYKYRLYPTKSQGQQLAQMAGNCRWLWNYMLDLNKKQYQIDKKFVFAYDMHNLIPELKTQNEWLKSTPGQSLQQKCTDLSRAMSSVWKSGFGFPKFKAKHKSKDSFRIPQNGGHIKISDSHITIPKVGEVKWKYHRPITGKLKSITVSRDIDDWYVSVLCETDEVPLMTEIDKSKTIGIDLGVSDFAVLSDGTKIKGPNYFKKSMRRLKKYQRRLAKKVKGSANRGHAGRRVAQVHQKIRNSRADWLHKQSHALTEKYDVICVEDLKIQQLLQKKELSRSIADQGWGIFVNQLKYKAKKKGKHLTKINPYLPSTKTCSCCGGVRKMKLSDRVYICENEGCTDYLKTKDRDLNAATNIHFWGLTATQNITFTTPGTGGNKACGDTTTDIELSGQYQVSAKQEAACPLGQR